MDPLTKARLESCLLLTLVFTLLLLSIIVGIFTHFSIQTKESSPPNEISHDMDKSTEQFNSSEDHLEQS